MVYGGVRVSVATRIHTTCSYFFSMIFVRLVWLCVCVCDSNAGSPQNARVKILEKTEFDVLHILRNNNYSPAIEIYMNDFARCGVSLAQHTSPYRPRAQRSL